MLRKIFDREHGQNLVIFALAVPVLIGILAVALDGGYAYAQRRRMQTAADAAAFAGARLIGLAQGAGQVSLIVNQYAVNNGAASATWEYINGGNGIRVTAQRTFNTFFAGLAGMPTMTASATADVQLDYLGSTGNLLPITIWDDPQFVPGVTYPLWDDIAELPGGFGWLEWAHGGGNFDLVEAILNPGLSGEINLGQWLDAFTGHSNSSNMQAAMESWLNKPVLIPLYDHLDLTGTNGLYHVSAFAEFVPTLMDFHGSVKHIEGRFQRRVVLNGTGGGTHGIRTMRLTN